MKQKSFLKYFHYKSLLVFFALFIYAFCSFTKSYAESYRHLNLGRKIDSYFYVVIGLGIPLSNSITSIEDVVDTKYYSELLSEAGKSFSDTQTFPADKIGAMAGIGYKSPYLLRLEINLDFQTFTRKIYTPDNFSYRSAHVGIRQFSLITHAYLDFFNSGSITPYIGGGLGVSNFVGSITYFDARQSIVYFTDTTVQSKNKFACIYEMNAGVRFGEKVASFSIEVFNRKTFGTFKHKTRGILFKGSFQI
jgi:opacity protein-like surface antigen